MQRHPIGVVGGSGYTGLELLRLVAAHPALDLRFACSDRWQGEAVADRLGLHGSFAGLKFAPPDLAAELSGGCAVVLLATPAEASLALAPQLLDRGVRVIDLSGAFRLRDAALYPAHYGFEHQAPALLAEAVYGLPELFSAEIAAARLVANPGCYATAITLALAPFLSQQFVDPSWIVVDAASGVTGAGRKSNEDFSFSEIADDFRAYKILRHQHTPEIVQTLARLGGATAPRLSFTPHLLPLRRGILATVHARLSKPLDSGGARALLHEAYAERPLVRVLDAPEQVSIRKVAHTPSCAVSAAVEGDELVVIAALDNLLKGAASEAVENLNRMLGLPELTGLSPQLGAHA